MKKILLPIIAILAFSLISRAQVFIFNDNMTSTRLSEISVTVQDSLTNEPVAFASVYVIPTKDTTITNFTLSDAEGKAKLEEVPVGSYSLHIEMMGYKPVIKQRYFRERKVDIGTVRMQQDERFLQAAVISDVGNPIVVKQDTVEFNASSFRVGANAMLKDLLKRMPGMEITEDGKVKFNGEEIDKLTVGGRTFFFNDQSTALNNLPASVVDKIRVIDRESESTRATGVQDGAREKVLDVALKKEYEEGWFGNVGLKAGTTIGSKGEELRDERGQLYSVNALVSAYTPKDQVTVIANGLNINESNAVWVIVDEDGERSSNDQGISAAAQLGVNANTTRIKDTETTVGANYKYSDTDFGTKSYRTTYQDDGYLYTASETVGKQFADSFNADVELKKEKGKVWYHFRPGFRWRKTDDINAGTSSTFRNGAEVNSSEEADRAVSENSTTHFNGDVTLRDLWNKEGRMLNVNMYGTYSDNSGNSSQTSLFTTASGSEDRSLNYVSDGWSAAGTGSVRYTEPLGKKWSVSGQAALTLSRSRSVKDAFDAAGPNAWYSSVSNRDYVNHRYELTTQYKFNDKSWVTFGASLSGVNQETFSRSYGIDQTTGKGEWDWFVTPTVRFQHTVGMNRFMLYASGYQVQPGASRMLPVLNITNPSRLTLGNIYLKPYSSTYFSFNWNRNDVKRFSNLMVYFFGNMVSNPISQAQWYDSDGIMYSVPVNAKSPSLSGSLYANYTTPLDQKKLWSLTVNGGLSYTGSISYQAGRTLAALDKDNFDYTAFMEDFWGDASGDRFYGGASGFSKSRTSYVNPNGGITLKYNQDRYSLSGGASTSARIARYSLNPDANLNTRSDSYFARGTYTSKHEFDFNTEITYITYHGYAAGYGQPEWQWNGEISKNIGAFNLSVKVNDILNQTRNLTHTVTANYEEDTYRLILGRYVLFGVKWNFGKMNAAHSQRAQRAAWNMVW